jgi:anti-sigma B factor antagonist
VRVAGELDLATVARLVRVLSEQQLQPRLVVLDLRELEFIDSSGVHAIVEASVRARQAGRWLVILRGPPNVDRMFTLTGTSAQLQIDDLGPAGPSARTLPPLGARTLSRLSARTLPRLSARASAR